MDGAEDEKSESKRIANAKSVLKVSILTIINGGDNISTYIPLFSRAKGAEVAVYVVVYNILVGVWCFVAFLIMKQKHILQIAQKYAEFIIPFLYIGLGIYITEKSQCYPWLVDNINNQFLGNPGQIVMGVVTAFFLSFVMAIMIWVRLHKQNTTLTSNEDISLKENMPNPAQSEHDVGPLSASIISKTTDYSHTDPLGSIRGETRLTEGSLGKEQLAPNNNPQPQGASADDEIQVAS